MVSLIGKFTPGACGKARQVPRHVGPEVRLRILLPRKKLWTGAKPQDEETYYPASHCCGMDRGHRDSLRHADACRLCLCNLFQARAVSDAAGDANLCSF